jgi:hypothetical protein
MKLKAIDQVHVSAVQSDSIRPGQEFVVSDSLGKDLLKALPGMLVKTGNDQPAQEPMSGPAPIAARAERAPRNKAEPRPRNKKDK